MSNFLLKKQYEKLNNYYDRADVKTMYTNKESFAAILIMY